MGKVRRCDKRCHTAKRDKCKCWCGGHFHGAKGEANREDFQHQLEDLAGTGRFKEGVTAYIRKMNLDSGEERK